jgi:hypothetical protein
VEGSLPSLTGDEGNEDYYVVNRAGLKALGYNKYISFECGCQSEDRAAAITTAVELIKKQWEEA